jgi:hypothetical protein
MTFKPLVPENVVTAYPDLTAAAGNPGGAYLGPGDYLVSPGGAYTAFVASADQLVVARGSTLSTLPSAIAWGTPAPQTVPSKAVIRWTEPRAPVHYLARQALTASQRAIGDGHSALAVLHGMGPGLTLSTPVGGHLLWTA